jgi:polar amino acid transport system substrate-binding protein
MASGLVPRVRRFAPLLALLAALPGRPLAEEDAPVVRAITIILPPAVFEENGALTGFSIDLWEEVARRIPVRTVYQVAPSAEAGYASLRAGEADIGVTGSFYTLRNHQGFELTYPILDSGLQVAVRSAGREAGEPSVLSFLELVVSKTMLYWLVTALILVVIPAHVIWFLDRRNPDGLTPPEPYIPGILHAFEWATAGLLGQVALMPRRGVARLLAHLWLFAGVVFVAFFTAQVTARLTVSHFRGSVNGPADLPGKTVATVAGTSSPAYLREIGAIPQEHPDPAGMFAALLSGKADAALLAAPVIRYHVTHEGAGRLRAVGPEVRRGNLAFVLPIGSPLRRPVDGALAAIREDGTYRRIHEKWFGPD